MLQKVPAKNRIYGRFMTGKCYSLEEKDTFSYTGVLSVITSKMYGPQARGNYSVEESWGTYTCQTLVLKTSLVKENGFHWIQFPFELLNFCASLECSIPNQHNFQGVLTLGQPRSFLSVSSGAVAYSFNISFWISARSSVKIEIISWLSNDLI